MDTPILEQLKHRLSKLTPDEQKGVLKFVESIEAESNTGAAGLSSLWDEIDEIVASVPEDAWDEVPADGAANHDHYLYGSRKRF